MALEDQAGRQTRRNWQKMSTIIYAIRCDGLFSSWEIVFCQKCRLFTPGQPWMLSVRTDEQLGCNRAMRLQGLPRQPSNIPNIHGYIFLYLTYM
jgi:hypothetical protein